MRLFCKRHHDSSLASLPLGCVSRQHFRKLGVDRVSREFSAAWRRKKKNTHTAAHVSVRWRFTPHGCFSPGRGVLKPTGGVTQIFNKRPQDLWRIYGSIGTFSGLLILPVAKSSCEIVARLTEFWELSPWVLAADVCLLSFPSVSMQCCSVLQGIYRLTFGHIQAGPGSRGDPNLVFFFLHFIPSFKKIDPWMWKAWH